VRYQARVDRLQADLVTALHSINTLKAQLSEAQANTVRVSPSATGSTKTTRAIGKSARRLTCLPFACA
jgi:multidrug resistance efflux pump